MLLIPAIDIINGKCVRLTQGDYNQKKEYSSKPVEIAKQYEAHGISHLHLVDLDGAKAKKVVNFRVLEDICKSTKLKVDFGGGVQSNDDIERVFDLGANQVTGGSIAVRKPDIFLKWVEDYGSEKIILGADARNRMVAIGGWQEKTDTNVVEFIKNYSKQGIQYVICTDVSKDGLLQGTANDLYADIQQKVPNLNLIASGGVATLDDLKSLESMPVYGVIIGKAIYENRITLDELSSLLN